VAVGFVRFPYLAVYSWVRVADLEDFLL